MAYVPEKPRYYDWMTVAEIGWFSAGFHAATFLLRYGEWTKKFDLDPKARLKNLSKGQYAKVGLALALAVNPEILILDEPTSGLDLLVRREFLGSMVSLAAEGRTIIISSHQIAEVERVASHVAFLVRSLALDGAAGRSASPYCAFGAALRGQRRIRRTWAASWSATAAASSFEPYSRTQVTKPWKSLRVAEGIHDVELSNLSLEEIYCAFWPERRVPSDACPCLEGLPRAARRMAGHRAPGGRYVCWDRLPRP